MAANAGCAGSFMVMIGMVSLRYKTKELINKNRLLKLFVYLLFGFCIGAIIGSVITPVSALSVDVLQDGKYTQLNITGEPPFDIYTDEGSNRYTWSNIVVLELEQGRINHLVIIDGTNETLPISVDVPVSNVDIFISICVIVCVIFGLLGIRYPLFILPALCLTIIWFAYMGKNPNLKELEMIVHSLASCIPFLTMAYWGINK